MNEEQDYQKQPADDTERTGDEVVIGTPTGPTSRVDEAEAPSGGSEVVISGGGGSTSPAPDPLEAVSRG